jgi:hypothetical protein
MALVRDSDSELARGLECSTAVLHRMWDWFNAAIWFARKSELRIIIALCLPLRELATRRPTVRLRHQGREAPTF